MFKKSFMRITSTILVLVLLLQIAPISAFAKKETKYAYNEYEVSGTNVIIDPAKYDGDTAQRRSEMAGSAMLYALYHMRGSGDAKGCNTIILKDDVYITQSTSETVGMVHSLAVTIRGEKSGGGQVKITPGPSEDYLFRFEGGTLTLENIILEGAENVGVAKFIDWDNIENEDEWVKYSGGAFYGEDANLILKNTIIRNFTKRGFMGSSFLGGLGFKIWGGAAVMMFDDPKEGASNVTYHYKFSMDSSSKIINCNVDNGECTGEEAGGSSVYIEGKNFEEAMNVTIAGEISGSTGTAVSCQFADVDITSTANIHDCNGSLGGAFRLTTCSLDMTGGLIENCSADKGGAFYITAGENNVYYGTYGYLGSHQFIGGTIQNCSATYGGAIYCERYEIKNNYADDNKKNYYLYDPYDTETGKFATGDKTVHVLLNGTSLLNNKATNQGGAVMNNCGYVEFRSGTIANNKAKEGGGIYKAYNANFILSGGTVKNNTASGNGPDVYVDLSDYYSDPNYFMVKGAPKTDTPIYAKTYAGGRFNDFMPIVVIGEVTGLIRFDFERMSSLVNPESDYPVVTGYGYGLTLENNHVTRGMDTYKMNNSDFRNLSMAPVDYLNVSGAGGGAYRYGDVFPVLIDGESTSDYIQLYTVYGCHTRSDLLIHMSANGSDETGDGTREKPVKTYAKARELMLVKHIYNYDKETKKTTYYYKNSLAILDDVTPEMGIPDEMLPMLWYPIDTSGCFVDYAGDNYARKDKEVALYSNEEDADANDIDWIVLKGDIKSKIKNNHFIFDMPASSVNVVADNGQVMFVKDVQLGLDVPDPDNVEATSFVTIESVTIANRDGENEETLSGQEIIDTFGSDIANVTWKKVEAGNCGFTKDEPFAIFFLETSFIKNKGNGYAIPDDIQISVNGYESAVRVDSYEKCTVAHLVNRKNIPELPMPEVTLSSESDVNVTNAGVTDTISVTTNGIYEFTKPIKWKITEVRDNDDILEIADTEGYLPAGENANLAIAKAIVSSNKIGEGEKTATIKISFSKEFGIINYEDMPDSITINYTLAPGEPLPMVQAEIDYVNETVVVTRDIGLEDYVVEYLLLEEESYNKSKWSSSYVETLKGNIIDLDGYISNYGQTPVELYVRYREIAKDPGPGEINIVSIPTRPKTPAMTVNYAAETTNEVAVYPLVYGTASDTLTQSANYEAVALTPGVNMYFQYAATLSSFASKVQRLIVDPRNPAPTGIAINYHDETTDVLIGTDIQYGYSEEELLSATLTGNDTAVALTPGVNTLFAYKATEDAFRSETFTLEVPVRPEKPAFTVDYTEEKTAELIPNTVCYGTNVNQMDFVGEDRRLDLTPGTDVYFFKPATQNAFKSDTQHLVVKTRRDAPDVKCVNEDVWCEGDGKIKGLDAPNEYRTKLENGEWSDWKDNGSKKTIDNLTSGTYKVRYTPTSDDFKSHTTTVTIGYDRTITVKFDTNKGSKISQQTGLKYGEKVTKPKDPEKTNCEFIGWYENALLSNAWDFGKDTVKDDQTLHAKWKRNKMDDPTNVGWDKFTAYWDAVDDEDEYLVILYKKDYNKDYLLQKITTKKTSYDLSSYVKKNGSGDYIFTVTAISSGIKDSETVPSIAKTYYKAPEITKNPENYTTTQTASASFSAGATVDREDNLYYQWQRKEKDGKKWENISGATSKDYTIDKTVLGDADYTYRCEVQDTKDNVVYTEEASLTVNKKPEVSISASATVIETNDEVTLTASAVYGTGKLTYKWTDKNASTDAEITIKLKKTSKIKVTVTDERGVSSSATVTIIVNKTNAELVYEQFVAIEDKIKNASDDAKSAGELYYLMKSAVEGYESLTSLEIAEFNLYNSNNMSAKYEEYRDLIKKADEFTEKVLAETEDYKPATKMEVEALKKECQELIESGVPVSTSISDEKTGTLAKLQAEVDATRAVEKEILTLARDVLSQLSTDELTKFKEQMKQYMGEIPEPESLPGFFTFLVQLFKGEAEMDFFTYISRAFESKTSAELRVFKDAFIDFLKNHENKDEMISYSCETLTKAYKAENEKAVQNTYWNYSALSKNEENMVAPAIKSLVKALYDKMVLEKNDIEKEAISFEGKLAEVEANPTMNSVRNILRRYDNFTDARKEVLSEGVAERIEKLRADYNKANDVSTAITNTFNEAKLSALLKNKDSAEAQEIITKYNELSDEQKALIKDELGKKANNVIAMVDIVKLMNSVTSQMSEKEKAEIFEEIMKKVNRLASRARNLFEKAIAEPSEGSVVADFADWRDKHQFVLKATTDKTEVQVFGVTDSSIKDVTETLNFSDLLFRVEDAPVHKATEGDVSKNNILSLDTSLVISVDDENGGYETKDVSLATPAQVKIKLPNNYDHESLELWNISYNNVATRIKDLSFVWEGYNLYVVFDTTTFGQFVFYGVRINTTADIYLKDFSNVTGNIGDIEIDRYCDAAQTFKVEVNDKGLGVDKIQYYITSSIYDYQGILNITSWKIYSGWTSLKTNSTNVIYIKVIDDFGNVSYSASTGIVVDTRSPKIIGIEKGTEFCKKPTLTVSDDNLVSVLVDKKASPATFELSPGTHSVTATDRCGNITSESITVHNDHIPGIWQCYDNKHWRNCVSCGTTLDEGKHKYNQKVVANEYVKKSPTYNDKGTYYKSCKCGKADSGLFSTFTGGPLKYDGTAPTVSVKISTNKWNSFWNKLTGGWLGKKTVKFTITASDGESGIDNKYHYDAGAPMDANGVKAISWWDKESGSTFSVNGKKTKEVYIKVVDKQGNYTIINSSNEIVVQYVHPK